MESIFSAVIDFFRDYANYIVVGWYIGALLLFMFIFFKYDKEHKRVFRDKFYKNIPIKYSPEVLSYFLTKDMNTNAYVAVLLNLIRKDLLVVTMIEQNAYLSLGSGMEATKQELMLRDFLINKVGNGEQFTLDNFKRMVNGNKSGPYFKNSYDMWRESSLFHVNMYKFFHKYKKAAGVVLYSVIGLLLWVLFMTNYNINFNNMNVIDMSMTFMIVISIILVVYLYGSKRRTEETNEAYYKWRAFNNYLKTFSIKNKDVDVSLIDTYFVYSIVLGSYNKIRNDILYNRKLYDEIEGQLKIKLDIFLNIKPLIRDIRKSIARNKGRSVVGSTIKKSNDTVETLGQNDIGDRGIGF